jgi:hypothetical protein
MKSYIDSQDTTEIRSDASDLRIHFDNSAKKTNMKKAMMVNKTK